MTRKTTQTVRATHALLPRSRALAALLRVGGAALFAAICAQHTPIPARGDAPAGRSDTCDARAYPRIACDVIVLDAAGLPVAGLADTGAEIEIEQSGVRTAPHLFKQIEDPAVRDSVLVLVDTGREVRAAVAHQEVLASVLDLLEPGGHAALITARVSGSPGRGDAARFDPGHDAGFDSDRRTRNGLARSLRARAGAPLYDGLCRSAALLAQAPTQPRLLIVISDGRDTGSAHCSRDDAVAAISRARIPVAVLALAAEKEDALLRRLARESGGVYVPPARIGAAAEHIEALRRRLALRYRVEFDARGAGDALLHARVNGVERTLRLRFDAGLRAPEITAVRLTHGAVALEPALLPDAEEIREITLTPQLAGRAARRVEYTLGAHVYVAHSAPFTVTLPLAALDPHAPTPLKLVAYAEDGASAGYVLQLARRGSAASLQLAPDQRAPTGPMPFSSAVLALGGTAMALVLGAGAWVSQRHRAAAHAAPRLRASAPVMHGNALAASLPKTVARGSAAQALDRTRIHGPAVARLCISAPGQPDRDVSMPADAPLRIGRAVTGAHDVCVRSAFVSGVHAAFDWRDGALLVTDHGSSNGTFHNGRAIAPGQPVRLAPGDHVLCADVCVRIVDISDASREGPGTAAWGGPAHDERVVA